MGVRGKGQGRWAKSKNVKRLGQENASDAAKLAAAQQAAIDAAAKLAETKEREAKATPRPDRAVDPDYHRNDRQDLPNR